MYALRTQRWLGQHNPSGKPDGSFVRADGHLTENKGAAQLFDNGNEAELFVEKWYANDGGYTFDGQPLPLFLVEVQTKPVVQKVLGCIKTFTPPPKNK